MTGFMQRYVRLGKQFVMGMENDLGRCPYLGSCGMRAVPRSTSYSLDRVLWAGCWCSGCVAAFWAALHGVEYAALRSVLWADDDGYGMDGKLLYVKWGTIRDVFGGRW